MGKRGLGCYNRPVTVVEWTRSRYCTGGNCVEPPTAHGVLLRDSKNPAQQPRRLDPDMWADFLDNIRAGEFDPW